MSLTIAFYKGTRAENRDAQLFDRLVCWWPRTRGRFSHCEISLDHVRTYARCWSASLRDGGVRQKWVDMASGHWVLVRLPFHDEQAAAAWFAARQGTPYDWPGVLGFVLPIVKQVRRWIYCSEGCAEAIRAGATMHGALLSAAAAAVLEGADRLPADRPGLAWPDPDIAPSALYAWCIAQPGAQLLEPAPRAPADQVPA